MPEVDPNQQPHDHLRELIYPKSKPPATSSLPAIIHRKISENGPITFADYMATALYHPQHGYYARSDRQVGRGGDFYTSVSIGPLFGKILARRFLNWWNENHQPNPWRIIEVGAHDGKLAFDILAELNQLSPQATAALQYAIPEPLPTLRQAQKKNLQPFHNTFFPETLSELHQHPLPGIAFGNEIIDALPFHLIRMGDHHWTELLVTLNETNHLTFTTTDIPPDSPLAAHLPPGQFPPNYQTEIRTNLAAFLGDLAKSLATGIMLFADYGFARPEYYDKSRNKGTLRTFSAHTAAEDPLATPGLRDITAHVDFTALTLAAATHGYHATDFRGQGPWLTDLARPILLAAENNPDPSFLRQFQSLTHPAHLGGSFHILELTSCGKTPPQTAHRLALT